jgi:enolase-phosphatase E1
VLAQKLLFTNTKTGDLTPCISRFFDTTTGTKIDTESYLNIARILRRLPSEIAFISDTSAELDAAKAARLQTFLCGRPGNQPQPANSHRSIQTLDEVFS